MASIPHSSPIIFFMLLPLLLSLLTSPTHSLTCSSQTFKPHYSNCTDLPSLKAYLHWTYDPTNSSISVVFIAPPAKPDGWIAWGINPTATGMVGAQALVALKDPKGALVVKTYNLSSYKSIEETKKLSFQVLDSKAEDSNGTMKIFATLALPENMTSLNQVWQVGGGVKDGMPEKHEFAPENLSAKSPLELLKGEEEASGPAAAAASGGGNKNGTATQSGNATGAGSRIWKSDLGVYGFLISFGILILGS